MSPFVGNRALLNSCLKSSLPGHSNVSVFLQSSWKSLFNFLAVKFHFSGMLLASLVLSVLPNFISSPNMISVRTHTAFMQFHMKTQCSKRTLNHFRGTVKKRADALQSGFPTHLFFPPSTCFLRTTQSTTITSLGEFEKYGLNSIRARSS